MDKLEIHFKYSNGQFRAGDHSEYRKLFYMSNYKVCPKCNSKDFTEEHYVANCRWNGDGFGTDVFKCNNCKWYTSFEYDEGGDSEYYYEARWNGWENERDVKEKELIDAQKQKESEEKNNDSN